MRWEVDRRVSDGEMPKSSGAARPSPAPAGGAAAREAPGTAPSRLPSSHVWGLDYLHTRTVLYSYGGLPYGTVLLFTQVEYPYGYC